MYVCVLPGLSALGGLERMSDRLQLELQMSAVMWTLAVTARIP